MAKWPIVFHEIIKSYISSEVSRAVQDRVGDLRKENYLKIKVIVHEPVVETYSNGATHTEYSTTIIATKDDVHIDIGFNSPS